MGLLWSPLNQVVGNPDALERGDLRGRAQGVVLRNLSPIVLAAGYAPGQRLEVLVGQEREIDPAGGGGAGRGRVLGRQLIDFAKQCEALARLVVGDLVVRDALGVDIDHDLTLLTALGN